MNASTPITEATGPNISGTYVPEQFFNEPFAYINGTDPNGTWGLLFPGAQGDITIQSWSLTITTPDPIAVTDGSGNFSFSGLAPGTYEVGVVPSPGDVQTFPAAGAEQTVSVTAGENATGISFGLQPASNLTTTSFYLSTQATSWGQSITINYTITNEGYGDAPAFDVGVFLSDDATIAASDPSLETLHFDGLAAQSSTTGQVTVALPSTPPAGFGSTDQTIVGFLIDPNHELTHNDAADDANQGLGTDQAALSMTPNQAVTTSPGVQQDPSIAVDPSNPNHIVVAYMDDSLVNTGYAGIGVAVSEDDGATWTYSSVPLPSEFNQGAAPDRPVRRPGERAHFVHGGDVPRAAAAGPDLPEQHPGGLRLRVEQWDLRVREHQRRPDLGPARRRGLAYVRGHAGDAGHDRSQRHRRPLRDGS